MKYFLLVISILVMFFISSCHQGDGTEKLNQPDEEGTTEVVGEITISREQFESMNMVLGDPVPAMFSNAVAANGYVMAAPTGSAKISTLISGRVRQIFISSGDFVERGQTLFSLESNDFILLQQTYAEAFQQLKLLRSDYERLQVLYNQNITSQKDFLKAESDYKSMHAQVEGIRARLKMMNIDPVVIERGDIIPFLSVTSPISGSIVRQELVLGQHLEPLETAMEVVNEGKLRLRLELFEKSISDLELGQPVRFALPNRPEQIFTATLSHIGKSVSEETRTVECFATISPGDKKYFLDNMFVEASIVTWEREAQAIPEDAIIRNDDLNFVLVLINEEAGQLTFRKVPVQTGATRQGHTEILDENLTEVLLEGVYSLWTPE